jgi:hypothetical protein
MLYEKKQNSELLFMKSRHNDNTSFVKYDESVLDNSLSPHIYKNDTMNTFLKLLQPLVSIILDHMNVVKNFKNYIVDKYDYKQ